MRPHRLMRTRRILAPLALTCAAVGCGGLDTPDKVHDLRLLAMRANPPQQVFYLNLQSTPSNAATLSGAGGLSGYGGGRTQARAAGRRDHGRRARLAKESLRSRHQHLDHRLCGHRVLRRGLFDPGGPAHHDHRPHHNPQLADGGSIHYIFATCTELDSATGQCLTTSPDYQVLKEDDFVPTDNQTWGEISATFAPGFTFLLHAIDNDAYHGFGGLPIVTQVSLTSGAESVVGIKRSTLFTWSSLPLPPADLNPVIPAVTVAGVEWPADDILWFSDPSVNFNVIPEVVPELEVSYPVPTSKGPPFTFKESWTYNFFCRRVVQPRRLGRGRCRRDVNPVNTDWVPPSSDSPQLVTYWMVVEDGRGGESIG